MAKIDVVMPQMGESITTGTITKWHKAPGDIVEIDEILLEISTDKVESEIPSPIKGKVVELLYKEGDTVDVGKVIAYIDDDLNASAGPSAKAPAASAPATQEEDLGPKKEVVATTRSTSAGDGPTVDELRADNHLEDNYGLAGSRPTGTGGGGYATDSGRGKDRRFYTPLVRAIAREQNVSLDELASIRGTGAGGRVNRKDLEDYLSQRGSGKTAPASSVAKASTAQVAQASVASTSASGRVEVIPMDNMRKAIARNMVASKLTSPHVNSISEVDLTHLVKYREKVKVDFKQSEGFNLTYTPFVMYALIQALKEYPLVNASIEGDNIIVRKDINLGCAVAVPGNGLVVPVIKNADSLNLVGLARTLNQLAAKARAKKLTMDELTGGTFTYTNVGSFGTLLATPVILQPQVGIYASGVIQKRVMVMNDDSIAVRSMMYGTHTYDHRLVDGELGGKFLEAAHRILREMDPEALL